MAATSHVKLDFLKPKVNFCWIWTLSWRKKLGLYQPPFEKINQLWSATRKEKGGKFPPSFLKIDKKYSNIGKTCPDCLHLGVKFSLEMQFREYLEEETRTFFHAESFFCMPCMKCLSKCFCSKKPVLPRKIPGCAPVPFNWTFHPSFHPNICYFCKFTHLQ